MNITEFAKAAGVSKSAVSRYFNDGYVSEEKRRLIEAAIEKKRRFIEPRHRSHRLCPERSGAERENKGDKACGSYYTTAFKRELCKRGGGNKSGTQ